MKGNYVLLKTLSHWCCGLSPKAAEKAGQVLGRVFWCLVPPKRKMLAVRNILRAKITADQKEAQRIAKESALRFGPLAVQMLRFPLLKEQNIWQYVTIEGSEYLNEAKTSGKGCVLAANHCGNWEMLGASLALLGYPLLSVGMKQKNEEFDHFIREYRSMVKQKVEYKTGVRDMYRRLKEGYFVGLLYDQDPGNTGIFSTLFGEKTLSATGPAHFSLLCHVPVIPIFIRQVGRERYHITIEKPMWTDPEKEKKEAVQEMTDQLNHKLESWIRLHPEDWFWLHNRWKWTDKICRGR